MNRILLWPAAVGWHLYRIATLRPAYEHLGDTRRTLATFSIVYFFTNLLRWWGLDGYMHTFQAQSLSLSILSAVGSYAFRYVLFRGKEGSTGLVAILGASSAVDLLVCLALVTGFASSPAVLWSYGFELLLMGCAFIRYKRLPPYLRAIGYRPNRH